MVSNNYFWTTSRSCDPPRWWNPITSCRFISPLNTSMNCFVFVHFVRIKYLAYMFCNIFLTVNCPPQLCWLLYPEQSTYFERGVQSLLNTCLVAVRFYIHPNHTPLKYSWLFRKKLAMKGLLIKGSCWCGDGGSFRRSLQHFLGAWRWETFQRWTRVSKLLDVVIQSTAAIEDFVKFSLQGDCLVSMSTKLS